MCAWCSSIMSAVMSLVGAGYLSTSMKLLIATFRCVKKGIDPDMWPIRFGSLLALIVVGQAVQFGDGVGILHRAHNQERRVEGRLLAPVERRFNVPVK